MKSVSQTLRRAIQKSDQTIYRIAKDADVDQSILRRFVSGERGLNVETVDRLAAALGFELAEIERVPGSGKTKRRGKR